MDGYIPSTNCCLTKYGTLVLKNSGSQSSKSKGGKCGRGPESCLFWILLRPNEIDV